MPSNSAITLAEGTAPRLAPGSVLLDRYRVERVLGEGGMGVVLAARHLELGHLVAFKFLRGEAAESSAVVDRFLREARAAAKLGGDHVTRVHDVGRLPSGEPYMILEHLVGADLDQLVAKRGPLSATAIALLMLQACEALQEAHEAGIVHRDLKPSNLFLHEPRPGKRTLKVLDFGISKDTSAVDAKLTATHAVLGSPLYMSPEQATEPLHVDPRSDLWSLGVVMYELATGEVPFLADTVPAIVAKILQHDPPPPSALAPDVPEWLDGVVMRCLSKSKEARFPSAAALATALRAHVGGERPHDALAALGLGADATSGPAVATSASVTGERPPVRSARVGALDTQEALRATALTPLEPGTVAPPRHLRAGLIAGLAALAIGLAATVALRLHRVAPDPVRTASAPAEPAAADPPQPETRPAQAPATALVAPATAEPEPAPPGTSSAPPVASSSAPIRTGRPRASSSATPPPRPSDPLDKL